MTDDSPTPEGWPPGTELEDEGESMRIVFRGHLWTCADFREWPAADIERWKERNRKHLNAHYRTTREYRLEQLAKRALALHLVLGHPAGRGLAGDIRKELGYA